jgi:hypothetical protein
MGFKGSGVKSLDWIDLAQDRNNCWAVAVAVMNSGSLSVADH